MKKFAFVLMAALVLCSGNLFSQSLDRGTEDDDLLAFMIHGKNFITGTPLPKTWGVSMDYARAVGINGFFYLNKYTIGTSPAAILLKLEGLNNESYGEWIDNSIKSFTKEYKGYRAEKPDWIIKNKNNYDVTVYVFKSNDTDVVQYSAYIDPKLDYYYVHLYLTIVEPDKHDEALKDFRRCLESSTFLGVGLQITN